MENPEKENRYLRAKERVEQVKKFYMSLCSYAFFMVFLAAINYWTNEWSYPWFLWAAFGWGVGLFFHALKVFGVNPLLGRKWKERKIREFMNENENNSRLR